jgi:hypothetical protein
MIDISSDGREGRYYSLYYTQFMVAERRCEAVSLSAICTQLGAGDCLLYQSDTIVNITGTHCL